MTPSAKRVALRYLEASGPQVPSAECLDAAQPGQCYRFAGKFVVDSDGELVHGKVTTPDGRTFAHAWVEHEGWIYDNAFPRGLPAQKYTRLLKPREQARYDMPEAVASMVRHGHWGPWKTPAPRRGP